MIFYSMDGDAFNRLQFNILDEFFNQKQKNSQCSALMVFSFMFVSILSFPLAGNLSLILKDSGRAGMTDLKPRNSAGGISLREGFIRRCLSL